jgi:hypothetical protein
LPQEIREKLLVRISEETFILQRQRDKYCDDLSAHPHVRKFFDVLCLIPIPLRVFGIMAGSLIANMSFEGIITNWGITLNENEFTSVQRLSSRLDQVVPMAFYTRIGEVKVFPVRPPLPLSIITYFKYHYPDDVRRHAPELRFGALKASCRDISNSFNEKHGLPRIPYYQCTDLANASLRTWISDLSFSDPPTDIVTCDHDGPCLHCHQIRTYCKRLSLTYESPGVINLEHLNDCAPFIFECHSGCPCNPAECPNRAVSSGWKCPLVVIRKRTTFGWGVLARKFIPRGTFVTQYLGRLLNHGERPDNVSPGDPGLCYPDAWAVPADQMLLIDTRDCGNVSSFIEPNQDANLVAISVSVDGSVKQHRIAFFAGQDIFPNEELHFAPNWEFPWDEELGKLRAEDPRIGAI